MNFSILSQTISTANKNESNGKEILNLTNSKLNNCERKSGEKRNNLNNENQRLKNKLQEQQRRVEVFFSSHVLKAYQGSARAVPRYP